MAPAVMNEIHSRVADVERICRLCLQEKRILMDIFEETEENSNLSIYRKIKACATVDVGYFSLQALFRGDGLPARICVPCLSSLNAAFDFRIQCENADRTLRNIYHLPVSDEVKEKKALRIVRNIKNQGAELKEPKPNHLQIIDLNHVILIKRQDKDITQEMDGSSEDNRKGKEKKKAEDFLKMTQVVKRNSKLSGNIINDDLISNNSQTVTSSDTLGVIFQSEKMEKLNRISFPAKKKHLQDIPEKKKEKKRALGDVKKSACPFCHKMLTRVNEHIRLLHRNKVYRCKKDNCGAEFLTLKNLQSHQLKCYNMEKPYKCLRCFKEFHRKCNYKAHIIRHSNKRDFQCQLCDKAFVDSTGLKRHFLKHHEPQQETFVSGCCDKKFKTKEGLKQHVLKGICGVQIFQVFESNGEVT